jgi:hypothetical protein
VEGGIRREHRVAFGAFEWLTIGKCLKWAWPEGNVVEGVRRFVEIRRVGGGRGGRRACWRYRRAVDVL